MFQLLGVRPDVSLLYSPSPRQQECFGSAFHTVRIRFKSLKKSEMEIQELIECRLESGGPDVFAQKRNNRNILNSIFWIIPIKKTFPT
jgi:hypothetical protein